jgi:HEAT repeat protein
VDAWQFRFESAPSVFCVDPQLRVLKAVQRETKPVEMWLAQARKAPTALSRSMAVERLRRFKDDARTVACLGECVSDGGEFWGTRARAASVLRALDTAESHAELMKAEARGVDHPRVLAEVIEGIGAKPDTPGVAEVLLRHSGPDAHVLVRQEALRRLGSAGADEATRERIIKALIAAASPGTSLRVRRAAMEALRSADDGRAVDGLCGVVRRSSEDSVPLRTQVIDLLVRLAQKDDAAKPPAAAAVLTALDDPRPGVCVAAIRALEQLAQAEALPRLRSLAEASAYASVREAAAAAIKALERSEVP